MLKLAVIGKDVSKSDSPAIHQFILSRFGTSCTYDKISVLPETFPLFAKQLFSRYDGFNVTIPFKGEIIPYLKGLKGDAEEFGAVNTVVTKERLGYNTDGYGFMLMLGNEGIEVKGRSVLVLGAGGAGRSIIRKLSRAGAEVYVFEREEVRLKAVYREFGGFKPLLQVPMAHFDLLVNCTGVGMHKTEGMLPSLTYTDGRADTAGPLLERCSAAVDLIYTPACSEFLRVAAQYGKPILNGSAMLFYQAYMADCIYLSRPSDAEEAGRLWREYREEKA